MPGQSQRQRQGQGRHREGHQGVAVSAVMIEEGTEDMKKGARGALFHDAIVVSVGQARLEVGRGDLELVEHLLHVVVRRELT